MKEQSTIVTRIRNRNSVLKHSIYNWLKWDVPIKIWDFRDDGCESAWDVVKELPDSLRERVTVFETKYEYRWNHCICWNAAVALCETEYVVVTDVDHLIESKLWLDPPASDELLYPPVMAKYGFCWFRKALWESVNGYNENLTGYGSDDTEFYTRVAAAGYKFRHIAGDTVHHLAHDDVARIAPLIQTGTEGLARNHATEVVHTSNRLNQLITQYLPWTQDSKRIRWDYTQLELGRWLAIRRVA